MYTLFVIGNIASGKSSACRYLASLGGRYIDLDQLAKSLYVPGSDLVFALADTFGWDVLSEDESVNTSRLASRVFSDPAETQRLNDLVHPYLMEQLGLRLVPENCCTVMKPSYPFAVVEVSVPQSIRDAFPLADDIVAIHAPLELRRKRAIERGMDPDDFDRRAALQLPEEELETMANIVIDNVGEPKTMFESLKGLLADRGVSLMEEGRIDVENAS